MATTFTRITDSTTLPAAVLKALSKAVINTELKHNHVCVVTHKGIVTAVGTNSYCTHTVQAKWAKKCGVENKSYLHSEIHALLKSKGRCDKLYVVRISKRGDWLLSKPCMVCTEAILSSTVKHCFYS